MPKIFGISPVVSAVFLIALSQAGESDVAAQLAQMQEQMRAMAQKMDAQQKKIDDQDKTIATLKGVRRDIGTSPGAEALKGNDEPTVYSKKEGGKGEGSDERPKT